LSSASKSLPLPCSSVLWEITEVLVRRSHKLVASFERPARPQPVGHWEHLAGCQESRLLPLPVAVTGTPRRWRGCPRG